MPGQLDEISAAIGEMRADIRSLAKRAEDDREAADDRHRDNTTALNNISTRVGSLETTVAPLAQTVAGMKPIVDSYQMTKWQRAGAIATVTGILAFVWWIISQFASKVIDVLLIKIGWR